MTEQEFREGIKEARKELTVLNWFGKRRGVCEALGVAFDIYFDYVGSIPETFHLVFKPRVAKMYWLGDRSPNNQETLERRLDFLSHFEEYMVVNQYYLAY